MGMIGNQPANNFLAVTKDTFDGNASSYTLSKAATTNGVAVYVENVRQIPTTAYSVSGTTLTFTGTTPAGTGNVYVLHHNTPASTATHPAAQDLTAANATITGTSTLTGAVSTGAGLTVANGITLSDGNITVASGHGIDFSATANSGGSMSSELFDDYEEGTWQWTLTDGSNNATPTAGGWGTGYYRKIGGLAYVTAYIRISSLGSASGDMKITGLPYTSLSGNTIGTASGFGCGRATNLDITALSSLGYQVGAGVSEVLLREWNDSGGTTASSSGSLSGDAIFIMTVIYPTA